MDSLAQTADGFRTIDADAALKARALANLGQWLSGPEFAPCRLHVLHR